MFHDQTTGIHLDEQAPGCCTAVEAVRELRAGRMVVVVDGDGSDGGGSAMVAAEHTTAAAINFLATHARGLVGLALTPERCAALELRPMTRAGDVPRGEAFTVSIEARHGVSTGISAADRAHTVRVAVAPDARPGDLVSPGHMFPVQAEADGLVDRRGRTEAAVDLARLAGLTPAGVVCEVLDDAGDEARLPDLRGFCATHGLRMVSVDALAAFRRDLDADVLRRSRPVGVTAVPSPSDRPADRALPPVAGDLELAA